MPHVASPTETASPEPFGPAERPELERLLDAWNTATQRLQQTHQTLRKQVERLSNELEIKNRELARKNRLADLGQLAAHVAHELRNGLMPLTLYAGLLRRRLNDDTGSLDVLDKIETGLSALDATVKDLLHFAADRQPQKTSFDIRPLVSDVCDSLQTQLDAQSVEVEIDVPPGMSLLADRDMLHRALLNLLLNALDAMPDGGNVYICACATPAGIEIEVADSGPGLGDDVLQKVFEPFFSTKQAGTGLGLAIVLRTAQAHGGEVTALNCPEGGAAFTLRFPRQALEAAA